MACFVVLLAGSLVIGGAQAWVGDTDAGSLTVTARDASGSLVQNGAVVLYTGDWEVVGEKELNADGQVRWTGLGAGEYHLELYRTSEEFWGGIEVTLSDGERAEVTVRRTEPYMTSLELVDAEEDGTYHVGDPITVSPEVRNGQTFPRTVRVRIAIDTNGDSAPDDTVTRGPLEIGGGSSEWYGYEFTPGEPGAVAVRVTVESKIGGKWVTTDTTAWTNPVQIESEETATATPDTSSPTPTASPTPGQQPSPTAGQASGTLGGLNETVYVGTGVVLAAVLASLYTASKMEWT